MPRAIKPNEAEQRLFEGLVQKHGSDEITVALCRSMAVLLAADVVDPKAANSAAQLAALLPPPRVDAGKPWNLGLLTDKQLRLLEKLGAIATGEVPPRSEHRPKSSRYWDAVELANKLDAVVKDERVGYAFRQLSIADATEIRSLVMSVLSPLLVQDLFKDTLESAFAPWGHTSPEPEPVVEPKATPTAAKSAPPAPPADNVVVLPRERSWAEILGPGESSPGCPSGSEYTGDGGRGRR